MAQTDLKKRLVLDPKILTDVVRLDQRDAHFQILDWTAVPLSDKGLFNSDGLMRVSGRGRGKNGIIPWEVVLKRFKNEDTNNMRLEEAQRELRLAQSGFFDRMPSPLAAPCFYLAAGDATDGQLWMEMIHDTTPPRWTLNEFTFAAYEIGRFNAACLSMTEFNDAPWASHSSWKGWFDSFSSIPDDQVWGNPYVQKAIPESLRTRQKQLISEKERFYAVLEHLPQVIMHLDLQRRNLMIRPRSDGSRELVAIDWAMCGMGPLGGDLYSLVGASALLFEIAGSDLSTFDTAIFAAYLAGLRAAGWDGNPDEIRLAYTAWLTLWLGVWPAGIMIWTSQNMIPFIFQQFGCGPDEFAAEGVEAFRFAIDRADEARALMDQLHLP